MFVTHMSTAHPSLPLLTHDVRYALTYRDAYVSPEEVLGLFPGIATLGVYAVAKFLYYSGRLDRLPAVLEAHLWGDYAAEQHEAAVALSGIEFWARLPKLEEHSRRLTGNRQAYRETAKVYNECEVYLLGSSTIPGVKAFNSEATRRYSLLFKPLQNGFISPKSWQAITIDPNEKQVELPCPLASLDSDAVVVDDIRNTGSTQTMVAEAFPQATFAVVNRGALPTTKRV